MITRLRLEAALSDPPPPRASGTTGRPRLTGKRRPTLEAQIANLADEIAYNNHDVDDGLRSRLLELDQLCEVSLFRRHRDAGLA